MLRAIALVTQSVLQNPLGAFLQSECERCGIQLDTLCVTDGCGDYTKKFREYRNVITWNCRMTHDWMAKQGKNVLYIENSLLAQRSGVFIDYRGFFSRSNLCVNRSWESQHEVGLEDFTQRFFNWKPMAGGDPDGAVLVCLQNTHDCNLHQEFPLGDAYADKVHAFLDVVFANLRTKRRVIIRPSPRFLQHWHENRHRYYLHRHWEVSWEGAFCDVLPRCSGLVTVNSTTASEAVTLGMPVATLGTGAFTGSGTTLECARQPFLLREFDAWKPDAAKCRAYAEAILGEHWLSYTAPKPGNTQLEKWLRAAF